MSKQVKRFFILVIIFIIVLTFIYYNGKIKIVSGLQLSKDYEKYLDKEIIINRALIENLHINFSPINYEEITIIQEDGNLIYLRYIYPKRISCIHADLTGVLRRDNQGYYFNVTKAICRE